MKRIVSLVAALFVLAGIVTTLTAFSPSSAHSTSIQRHPLSCGAIVRGAIQEGTATPYQGEQPCRHKHLLLSWASDGTHSSPRIVVPANWVLSYICDGGPGALYINGRFILSMRCDNAWHSKQFGRGGYVRVWVDRQADIVIEA